MDASSDLFGSAGDLLVPLIDLHHRLMSALEGLASELLDEAAAALNVAFGGGLAALAPDAGVLGRIDEVLAWLSRDLGIVAATTSVADAAPTPTSNWRRGPPRRRRRRRERATPGRRRCVQRHRFAAALDPLRASSPPRRRPGNAHHGRRLARRHERRERPGGAAHGLRRWAWPALEQLLPAFVGTGFDGSGRLRRPAHPRPGTDPRRGRTRCLDEAGQFLAGLGDAVVAALEELAAGRRGPAPAAQPDGVDGAGGRRRPRRAVSAQVEAIAPATLAEHVRLVLFAAVRPELEALDQAQLVTQLEAVRQGLLDAPR